MKPIKYRQYTKTGCGSFSIANIFDDHRMVEHIPTMHESLAYLNRKMQRFHNGIFIDVQFLTCAYFRNGYKLQSLQAEEFFARHAGDIQGQITSMEGVAIPYLITVSRRKGAAHMVPIVHDLDSNTFYAADSCTDKVQALKLSDLLERYNIISVSIFSKWNRKNEPRIMFANKNYFEHIY